MTLLRQAGKAVLVVSTAAAVITSGSAVAGAATSHHRARVTFHVDKHNRVHAPQSIHPGLVHLRATGELPIVLLVKSRHHHTATLLARDLHRNSDKRFFKDFSFVTELHDGYTRLSRGTYYAVGPLGHPSATKIAQLRVTGATQNTRVPAAATYRIDSHRKLHAPTSQSSHRWVHVVNNSSTPQSLFLLGLAKDASAADVNAFVAHPTEANFDKLDVVDFANGGLVGAHQQFWSDAHLHSRRYIATLFATTKDFAFASPHVVTVR